MSTQFPTTPTGGDDAAVLTARERQQWLFSPARPLVERFGNEFFRALPESPGVYLMRGQGGRPRRPRVLYVGKARNLRQRLGSYRHVHPDRDSRKTLRLVHAVEEISWEECADETAALLRENALLREHRPLFNRVNVRPEAHGCVGIRIDGNAMEFRLGEPTGAGWQWHGCFKAGRRFALGALLRLLVQADRSLANWSELPARLLSDRAPSIYRLRVRSGGRTESLLHGYLSGRSWELVDWLADQLAVQPLPEPFLAGWRATDLDVLRSFYLNGTRRNRRWREQLGMHDDEILRPEDLDDLPVRIKLAPEPSPWPEVAAAT